jgi:hypothetical protein
MGWDAYPLLATAVTEPKKREEDRAGMMKATGDQPCGKQESDKSGSIILFNIK